MPYCEYMTKTAQELQALARDGTGVAVLPIGAVEQHGPHLPVGTDAYCAGALAARAMPLIQSPAQFFLLPTIVYALSVEHLHVPGTITLTPTTLLHMLCDIGESLIRLGIQKLVVINGHGGNDHVLQLAGRTLRGKGLFTYLVDGGAIRARLGAADYDVHADKTETSLMMALKPDLVHSELITPHLGGSIEKWRQSADMRGDLISCWYIEDISVDGVVGDPSASSAAFGEAFLARQAEAIASALALAATL